MDTGIAGYRKVIAMAVAGVIAFILNYSGTTTDALAAMGLHVVDLQEAITELVMQIGMMAVFVASQPNERGESLWKDWWHWAAIGMGGVIVVTAGVALL